MLSTAVFWEFPRPLLSVKIIRLKMKKLMIFFGTAKKTVRMRKPHVHIFAPAGIFKRQKKLPVFPAAFPCVTHFHARG